MKTYATPLQAILALRRGCIVDELENAVPRWVLYWLETRAPTCCELRYEGARAVAWFHGWAARHKFEDEMIRARAWRRLKGRPRKRRGPAVRRRPIFVGIDLARGPDVTVRWYQCGSCGHRGSWPAHACGRCKMVFPSERQAA